MTRILTAWGLSVVLLVLGVLAVIVVRVMAT